MENAWRLTVRMRYLIWPQSVRFRNVPGLTPVKAPARDTDRKFAPVTESPRGVMRSTGDNLAGSEVAFEVRLFNSISALAGGGYGGIPMRLPAGSNVADLLAALSIPAEKVFLVLVNGRDITPSLYGGVRTDYYIQDGDRVAFSGPVPYGWGYGSPVV